MNCICCAAKFDPALGPCPRCSWNPDSAHDALAGYAVGDIVNKKYIIEESLGKGRLGTTIKAFDKKENRPVTLKFIHPGLIPDEDAGMRFLTAMNAISSLGDKRLASPIEAARDQDRYFVVREFFAGVPLKQLMDDQRICGQVFPTDEAVHLIEKLARALVSIRGGSHGSFSPSKVWVSADDFKIVDYGLAASLPTAAVWYALRKGSGAFYVAPEQTYNYPSSPQGDVFAIGVLLGELLSLAEFQGDVDVFRESEPELSHEMEALIRCSLSSDTGTRYEHAIEFVSALYDITGRPRSFTMPPDNTAVVPAAFINQLRSMSLAPPPSDASAGEEEKGSSGEITKQVAVESIAQQSSLISTCPDAPALDASPEVSAREKFHPPPFRPTDLSGLALSAKAVPPGTTHRAPPPPSSARKSLFPPPPSVSAGPAVPKPVDALSASKGMPEASVPPPPRPSIPSPPSVSRQAPPTSTDAANEISALKAMLTPKSLPALSLPNHPPPVSEKEKSSPASASVENPERYDGISPRFLRAARLSPVSEKEKSSPASASVENPERYDGINPRFLRAAAKLERARISRTGTGAREKKAVQADEEDWRQRLEASSSGSVISFLPPTTIENPEKVEGFPGNQRNEKPQTAMRPISPPKPPPLPRRK